MARERRETWEQRVAAWRKSGLSVREFASRVGINANTLANWRWRLQSEERAAGVGADFVEVTDAVLSVAEVGAAPLEVVCRGGRVVRVPADFDAVALRRLVDALEQR